MIYTWAKLVGGAFLTTGAALVLSGTELSWLRPPLRGFCLDGTGAGEGLLVPVNTHFLIYKYDKSWKNNVAFYFVTLII